MQGGTGKGYPETAWGGFFFVWEVGFCGNFGVNYLGRRFGYDFPKDFFQGEKTAPD